MNKFNNAKGAAGWWRCWTPDPGGKGLLLLLINNGNNDRLTLNTIDPDTGKIDEIENFTERLGSDIVENAWYRLELFVTAREVDDSLSVVAVIRPHEDPSDPDSDLLPGLLCCSQGRVSANWGWRKRGSSGMTAWTRSAVVNTSFTNFFASTSCNIP